MEISCKFEHSNWTTYYGIHNEYACTEIKTDITEPFQEVKKINGVHKKGKCNKNVKGMRFYNSTLDYFPRGLQKHFPNLAHLTILDSGISKITRRDLKGLESLVDLQIDGCKLTSLPDDLFADMPNLRSIYFQYNKIEFASSKLLERFAGRKDVIVSFLGNTNINECYDPEEEGSSESMNELMRLIDEKCKKPIVKPQESGSFRKIARELWISERFSDFTIITGTKEFKGHKNILGVRSSVFAKIIEDHNDASEIKINDFSPNAVEALLLFIYTGDIKEGDEDDAIENFKIADKFKVNKMKSAYEKILADEINEENAFEIFMLAHQYSAKELKTEALQVVASSLLRRSRENVLPEKMFEDPEKLKMMGDIYRLYMKIIKD